MLCPYPWGVGERGPDSLEASWLFPLTLQNQIPSLTLCYLPRCHHVLGVQEESGLNPIPHKALSPAVMPSI